MSLRAVVERWTAWLQGPPPEADGTYLIRPWALYSSSATYQVDVAINKRRVWFELASGLTVFAAGVAILMMQSDESLSTAQVTSLGFSICGALVAAKVVGPLVILRPARRVPKEHWKAPAVVHRRSRFSDAILLTLDLIVVMLGVPLVGAFVFLLVKSPDLAKSRADLWSTVQIIVVVGALLLSSVVRLLWRRARTFTILQTAPVVLLIGWMAANAPARSWPSLTFVILVFGPLFMGALLRWWRGERT